MAKSERIALGSPWLRLATLAFAKGTPTRCQPTPALKEPILYVLPMCVLRVLPMCVPAAHPGPLPKGEGDSQPGCR